MNVQQALQHAQQTLNPISGNAHYAARRLLGHILNQDATWLHLHPDAELAPEQHLAFQDALTRLQDGYPLAYILGEWGFYQWDFVVNEHVLVPRPETEVLVEQAVQWAQIHYPAGHFVDIGTGSGIIAVSVGLLLPQASVLALDVSPTTLAVATLNAERLKANNVQFQQSDLLAEIPPQPFDMILANLPYIDSDELQTLAVSHYEPALALDGGPAGMILIERLLKQSVDYIQAGSTIWLEIGIEQGRAVQNLAQSIFPHAQVDILHDLTNRDRVAKIVIQETPS
ncbi:MAG: peptide chain release factor N(5)-glutamine methyltransferase [Chloroflexi bacterium]|nr:peptide chain release factor N(5)-glutamine methyltransferase [Chloroflexota bacterium]